MVYYKKVNYFEARMPLDSISGAPNAQGAAVSGVTQEFNRVIDHAIAQGIEAAVFLQCWREGDWAGCREFGFEPSRQVMAGSNFPGVPT